MSCNSITMLAYVTYCQIAIKNIYRLAIHKTVHNYLEGCRKVLPCVKLLLLLAGASQNYVQDA
jgi:hypothetical protein